VKHLVPPDTSNGHDADSSHFYVMYHLAVTMTFEA
jgi:hypothetical protein